MNADTKNTILTMALEAKQVALEQARMQSEDHRSKLVRCVELEEEKTRQLMEEVSFIQSQLYPRGKMFQRSFSELLRRSVRCIGDSRPRKPS